MATKSELQTLITTNLPSGGDILAADHREVENAFVDELYPTVVTDSVDNETYTTKAGANLDYSITIHKSGNVCHIKGTVINNQTYSLDAQNIFTWKDTPFKPKASVNNFTFRAIFGTSNNINLFLSDAGLNLTSSINALGSYSFNYQFYIAQD